MIASKSGQNPREKMKEVPGFAWAAAAAAVSINRQKEDVKKIFVLNFTLFSSSYIEIDLPYNTV